MSDQPAPTTDPAGIARTTDGQIAPTAETAAQPASTPTTTPTTEPPKAEAPPKSEGSLLNAEAKEGEQAKPEGAPEAYADYKVPDGFTLDPEIKGKADTIFKEMNLTQEQAQKLVDFYTAQTQEAFDAPFKAYLDTRQEWRQQAESDPDLRGKLGPGGEVLTTVARALNSLGDAKLASDFREAMDLTGAGDNPAFIKAFYRMAQRLTEGSHVAGRGPAPQGQGRPGVPTRSPAADLWPNLPSTANQR